MRLRDRRSLLAATVLAAAYLAPVPALLCWLSGIEIRWSPVMAPLLATTTTLLIWRLGLRAWFVSRTHGWREGLLSLPRVVIANMIEMQAAFRAFRTYVPGELPAWDKTSHRFPEAPPCD
jgi:adsorption protein B